MSALRPKTRTVAALLWGLALLVGCVSGESFAYSFQKGEVYRYRIMSSLAGTRSLGGPGQEVTMQNYWTVTQQVLEARPDGTATIVLRYVSVRQIVQGLELPTLPIEGKSIAVDLTPQGRPSNFRAQGFDASNAPQAWDLLVLGPIFPARPLKPGDQWAEKVTIDLPQTPPITVHLNYAFEGYDQVQGLRAARVSFTSSADLEFLMVSYGVSSSTRVRVHHRGAAYFGLEKKRWLESVGQSFTESTLSGPPPSPAPEVHLQLRGEFTVELEP